MGLRDYFGRLFRRPPSGESFELRPAEQVALAYLLRFESATLEALRSELESRHWAVTPDADEAMSRLVGLGLAEARLQPDVRGATFVVTPKGRRFKGRLPDDPRSVTEFWI
ncbi:MAG TPA: hypothetical protein VNN10_09925 [Dehalococcoidia bacterium]|nr:hypothetical protein [Dehalococcoidia bacterium]